MWHHTPTHTYHMHPRLASSESGPVDQQLTIFYSGGVNVFAKVPANKAHAIMLLLSGCSTQNRGSASKILTSDHAGHDDQSKTTWAETTAAASSFQYAAGNASFNTIALQQLHRQQQIRAQRKRSQAEVTFARKASLARFLERRKDRVKPIHMKDICVPGVPIDGCQSPCKKMKL